MYKVYFRNRNQVILYECELKGQISDGNWENSQPFHHWEKPCNAEALVAKNEKELGLNFYPSLNYGFSSPRLFDVVKYRMLFYVKIYNTFPNLSLDNHHTYDLLCDYGNEEITWKNIIDSINSGNKYYKEKSDWLEEKLDAKTDEKKEKVCKKIKEYNYDLITLKRDLRDMSKIWKLQHQE